jgi:hypothetical protein
MNLYTAIEIKLFKTLNSPAKIQDFLNGLRFNFEKDGETCYSPRMVLKYKIAHCMEGAMLAAAILEFNGHKPLVMDLRSVKPHDDDHVVAVFKQFGCFGAISKTNHAVLRYREPVYKTIRELALSYFHEYFLNNGKKTLREYSEAFDLKHFDSFPLPLGEGRVRVDWRTSPENLFKIPRHLDKIKHYKILSPAQIKNLRLAEKIEIRAGKITEWKKYR